MEVWLCVHDLWRGACLFLRVGFSLIIVICSFGHVWPTCKTTSRRNRKTEFVICSFDRSLHEKLPRGEIEKHLHWQLLT